MKLDSAKIYLNKTVDDLCAFVARKPRFSEMDPVWSDLVDTLPEKLVPKIDRAGVQTENLTPDQQAFRENGFLILPAFLPDALIDAYVQVREGQPPGGFPAPTPYMQVDEIKDICLYKSLSDKLEELIGESMAMHLNLTGWVSTERNWHQDEYLNPPGVNGWYVAVWMALDDIHPDSGPFEYVPGSHRWEMVRRDRVLRYLSKDEIFKGHWPKASERFLTGLFEQQVSERRVQSERFTANKGDVLIWHSRLMHRGTVPRDKSRLRKSLITHYSGITHRPEGWPVARYRDQGYYFRIRD